MIDLTPQDILTTAREIAREYRDDNLTLTLRQLYYQFVARGVAASSDKTYKRIGSVLTKARYGGQFPVDWIDDRGRTSHGGDATRDDVDPAWGLYQAASYLHDAPEVFLSRGKWLDQPIYVSVWVEKEALSGIIGDAAGAEGVSWMACKGYPSVSALREWLGQAALACSGRAFIPDGNDHETHRGGCKRAVVLYLGDHDPDGLEIPKAAERGLRQLMTVTGLHVNLIFKRIALTREQIEQYRPPPFPAKITSARFAKYLRETGLTEAWELDALEPRVLRALISREVRALFDRDIRADNRDSVDVVREAMRDQLLEGDFTARAVDGWDAPERDLPSETDVLEAMRQEAGGITFNEDGEPEDIGDEEEDSYHLPVDDDDGEE